MDLNVVYFNPCLYSAQRVKRSEQIVTINLDLNFKGIIIRLLAQIDTKEMVTEKAILVNVRKLK